ncbi:hypothetical protein [Geobacillus sp. YF-1]|uniref:hypothetical protein n=1 Tax=Geobacillus sp. YF-1 TaxID=3457480 RepID=UPI00404590F8
MIKEGMRSVHKRIVVAVSAVQFALLALVAVIISDIHDRFFPEQLGVKAKVTLDFSQSGLSDEEAFRQLGSISDRLGLGLMKVAPDLRGDQSGQVFVKVGAHGSFPKQIQRFGNQPDAEIRDNGALVHSFANGDYLVTGKTDRIAEFKDWLTSRRVDQQWNEETLITIFQFLTLQSDFGVTLLAVSALMVSLALYWLAVKARGRALRVLAGVAHSMRGLRPFSHGDGFCCRAVGCVGLRLRGFRLWLGLCALLCQGVAFGRMDRHLPDYDLHLGSLGRLMAKPCDVGDAGAGRQKFGEKFGGSENRHVRPRSRHSRAGLRRIYGSKKNGTGTGHVEIVGRSGRLRVPVPSGKSGGSGKRENVPEASAFCRRHGAGSRGGGSGGAISRVDGRVLLR